ncbi:MAG: NfeD family protein [Actinomycetota bacterium]
MRNRVRLLTAIVLAVTGLVMSAMGAAAQDQPDTTEAPEPADGPREVVDVVEVSGLIDPIVEDDLISRLEGAEATNAGDDEEVLAIVLQVNSAGAVIDDADLLALVERMQESTVPIGIWVGPSGSQLKGKATYLLAGADWTAISGESRIGDLGEPLDGEPDELLGPETEQLRNRMLGRVDARELELIDTSSSIIGEFVLSMMDAGIIPERVNLDEQDNGLIFRETAVPPRFNKLPLIDQLFHTMASPSITYLLLVAGLGLLLLEFFTAGVGIAGVTGALCLLGAGYGLGVLPFRPWALVLLVLCVLAFAVDVQTGVPRFWSGVGVVLLIVGSLFLFDEFAPSWITLGSGMIGVLLLMFTAMPNLVRTRFGTSTLGREWMKSEIGEAVTAVDPEGTVRVRDALWHARTNRATPIGEGEALRVVDLDGPILEVEPVEGAARDYREMRGKRRGSDESAPTDATTS